MPDFSVVLNGVLTLIILLVPGFLFEKTRFVPEGFTKGLTNLTLYVAQPFMIMNSFLRTFDANILADIGFEILLGLIGYSAAFCVICLFFKKMPGDKRGVLRFMMLFTNAGFMGLPILQSIFPENADLVVMYATGVIVCHNILTWTLGVRVLAPSEKGKGIKSLLNPGVIGCTTGILLFAVSAASFLPPFVLNVSNQLAGLATPLAMYIVGANLAHFDFKSLARTPQLILAAFMRLFVLPAIIFGVFYVIKLTNLLPLTPLLVAVPFLQFCMPSASVTTMMSVRFGGDPVFASAGVSLTTVLSLLSIPVMSLFLSFL